MVTRQSRGAREEALSAKAVYERYAASLSRYLLRRVQRPEDVEDLTQEIFELFVRRKDRSQVVRNPLAYLFRIAFHVVGAALAEEGRSPVIFGSAQSDLAENDGAPSIDAAEELAVTQDVQAALASLPANHLTALMLVEGHGMSYKEAARVSGFTASTIATYVMHARAALKLALDDQWKRKPR
ncbi:MAG: RNA polymerase sigma factor [Gammaproteobacteria bacterium]